MSIDSLQEKIRRTKCPVMLELAGSVADLPPHLMQLEASPAAACGRFCRELLEALKGTVPAVRFRFASFALLGPEGLAVLSQSLALAGKLGYYVTLDAPGILGVRDAEQAAQILFGENSPFPCDSLILSCYLGSDCLKPFLPGCGSGKDVFVAVRTPNRSAPELQDLLAGGRLVHIAAADIVSRFAADGGKKYGYASVAVLSAANAPDSLRSLRSKYPKLFLLVDGYCAVGANAKNCAYAFDKLGHGAIVCGGAIARAWQKDGSDGAEYVLQAQTEVERMKRNLSRYFRIM